MIDALARQRPLALLCEDLHWADEATLDVVRLLGRRVASLLTLLVLTYRDDEVVGDHPLRVVLGELATSRGVARLAVPRLSAAAVQAPPAPHRAAGETGAWDTSGPGASPQAGRPSRPAAARGAGACGRSLGVTRAGRA